MISCIRLLPSAGVTACLLWAATCQAEAFRGRPQPRRPLRVRQASRDDVRQPTTQGFLNQLMKQVASVRLVNASDDWRVSQ